jgi:AraC-like DNA-binding protein
MLSNFQPDKFPSEIVTSGRTRHPDVRLPIRVMEKRNALEHLSLPCFKIIFLEGGAGFCTVNDVRTITVSPSIICLNEQESAKFEGVLNLQGLFFRPEVVNEVLSVNSIRKGKTDSFGLSGILDLFWVKPFTGTRRRPAEISLTPAAAQAVKSIIEKVKTELTNQETSFWPCRARSHLVELLFLIGRLYLDCKEIPNMVSDDIEIAPVILFLHTNYGKKITINGLAHEFGTNRNSIQFKFSKATGKSIGLYLRELRLSIARSLLADTKLPVARVLEQTGFTDATHFGRSFRKRFGVTPAQFRKIRDK